MESDRANGPVAPTHYCCGPWVSNGDMSAPQSCHSSCSQKKNGINAERWNSAVSCCLVWEEMGEYLSLLQVPQHWTQIRKNLATADIITDNSVPWTFWVSGRVKQMTPDAKGRVTYDTWWKGLVWHVQDKTKTNTLERPVDKLCLICETEVYYTYTCYTQNIQVYPHVVMNLWHLNASARLYIHTHT